MKKLNNLACILLLTLFVYSCVPVRKYEDEKTKNAKLRLDNRNYKERLTRIIEENEDLSKRIANAEEYNKLLVEDTTRYGVVYRRLKKHNEDLNDLYEKVIKQNKDLLITSSTENQRLSLELENKKLELERKETELKKKNASLDEKQKNINKLTSSLEARV